MASALWLLEAKAFAEEDRTPAATTIKYWLKPGSYVIGKPKHSEIAIDEDKSISRKHGGLEVPAAGEREGDAPYVLLTDSSKYGTVVSRDGSFDEKKVEKVASGGPAARVESGCMLKFGFKSPFRVLQQDWVLYLSSAQRQGADAAALAAVEAAAAATGLPLTDELPDHAGTRMLALGGSPLIVDGPLLLGLLRGYPAVGANWLLEWQQQKVWCNARPQEEGYPVQMQYRSSDGRLKALPPGAGATALAAARDSQLLAGRPLLWLPPARDAALQEAAEALGAGNHNVAASGRASAAAKEEGAVLVRGSEEDHMPAAYSHLPWTTPDLLIAGILEGDMAAAVRQPVTPPDTTTPASKKGRGRGKAPGSRSASAKKGRGRGKAAAAAAPEEQHESGSETDASEDLTHLKDTQRVLAKDVRAAPAAAAHAAAEQHEEQPPPQQVQHDDEEQPASAAGRRGKKVTAGASPAAIAAVAEPAAVGDKAAAGGRKRRAPEPAEQQEEHAAAPSPAPAKKQRQAAPPAAAVAPVAPAVKPAAEGWHNRGAGHPQPPAADEQASPDGRARAAPATAAGAAASAAKPSSAAGRRAARRGGGPPADGPAAAVVAAAAEAEAAGEAAEGEEEVEEEEVEEDGPTRVCYASLIVPAAPPPAAPSSGADEGPNFKAFRKAGSAAVAAAAPRAVVAFDAQPYEELNQPSAEAFLKAEAERRRRNAQADELFAANIKAKKAPQLPDPDGDSPPAKGRGRGGGRGGAKKAAAAAPAGQKSILGFLPPAGRGRGGRGGRGGHGGK